MEQLLLCPGVSCQKDMEAFPGKDLEEYRFLGCRNPEMRREQRAQMKRMVSYPVEQLVLDLAPHLGIDGCGKLLQMAAGSQQVQLGKRLVGHHPGPERGKMDGQLPLAVCSVDDILLFGTEVLPDRLQLGLVVVAQGPELPEEVKERHRKIREREVYMGCGRGWCEKPGG